ncbi:MAG: molybdopterin oxidoreductase [Pirellula sp.]|nr:molybdopterin oxidoreductase [Pirellula sp.]
MLITTDNSTLATADQAEAAGIRFSAGGPALVEVLLAEQQELSAVERFSRRHDTELQGAGGHAQARHYHDLIPLSLPAAGEQYAFRVDLDACSGCKACVTACHQLNGLADDETWRSVGLLVGEKLIPPVSPYARMSTELPVLKNVTTACHHCVEPGCLSGCPTRAYEKDPATGVVRHLDDQCMGCQYCLLMCPYEVPQYQPALGIVRKCDMCRQRLAADEAPACVQACPNRAISIQIVRREDAFAAAARGEFLPDSPDPRHTIPTTTFVSRDAALSALRAADTFCDRPQHVHASLVAMLCLTQAAVGLLLVDEALARLAGAAWPASARKSAGLTAAVVGIIGVHAAMLHLGRPTLAVKAWLGWRTSWLSREVIVFGLWMAAVGAYAASLLQLLPTNYSALTRYLAIGLGIGGVYCSAMIYAATGRTWWSLPRNAARFFGTMFTLGLYGAACLAAICGSTVALPIAIAAAGVIAAKTIWEAVVLRHYFSSQRHALLRTARLLAGELRLIVDVRSVASCFAVGLVYLLAAVPTYAVLWTSIALVAAAVGELIERTLFFAAVVPARMPGGIRT